MDAPFVFGRIAADNNFTNRDKEAEQLVLNFSALINTILISPRRWGKSSLVSKAAKMAAKKHKNLRFCLIDLYNVRTEEQFYQLLAQEVLRASSSKMGEVMENAKKVAGKIIPKISFSPEENSEFTVGIDWQEVKKHPDEILNLAEKIAKEKNLKFIICIDEFQNISDFDNPLALQKKLRSHWQKHQNTAYCLYGSKRHMLLDVFTSASMPFYKFGDIIFLQKIAEKQLVDFVKKRFDETNKKISIENARLITQLAECHPYYVQQLAQQVWLRTDKISNAEIVNESFENLSMQLSLLFQTLTYELSNTQVNFMHAVLKNASQLSSKSTIAEFNLGSSANVIKIKQALINKEIIDIHGDKIMLLDPIYKYWLKKYYFRIVK